MDKNIKVIPLREKRNPCAVRLQRILDNHYGNVVGTSETENCMGELIADIKWFCRVTGRDFKKLTI